MEIGGGGGVIAAPQMPAKRRVSRVAIGLSVLWALVSAACLVRIMVTGAQATADMMSEPSFSIPGETTIQIDEPGTYAVFEETGTQSQNGPVSYSQNSFTVLRPKDVDVTGPDGRSVATMPIGGNETLTRGQTIFTASVEFRAPTTGAYVVDVNGGRPGGSAVVTRELADQFAPLLPWLIVMIASGFLFFFSIIAVIISAVRASRANRALAQPVAAYPYGSPYPPSPSAWPQSPSAWPPKPGPQPGPQQTSSAWPPTPGAPQPGSQPRPPAPPR